MLFNAARKSKKMNRLAFLSYEKLIIIQWVMNQFL